jgi:hypothetical protein
MIWLLRLYYQDEVDAVIINSHSTASLSAVLAGILVMATPTAWPGEIVMSLEEPTAGSTYSGVANIRGWVVGSKGINRVELYVDGRYEGNIPVGGKRSDVGGAYPNYPNAGSSGFSMAFNYSGEAAGGHSIRVRAIDAEGAVNEKSVGFQVARFDNPYVSNPSQVNLSDATVSTDGKKIFFYGLSVAGVTYDATLDWRTPIQGYAFSQIIQTGSKQTYLLVVETAGNGKGEVSGGGDYADGESVRLTATPSAGSTFVGWNPYPCAASFTMPATSLTCTATFTQEVIYYTVTASAGSGGMISPSSQVVSSGASTSFTVRPDSGYRITEVSGCGGSLSGTTYTTGLITGICTVSARFERETYTVTLNTAGGGVGQVSGGGSYTAGSTVTLTATPSIASTFEGWSPSPCAENFVMPAQNLTCTATFSVFRRCIVPGC